MDDLETILNPTGISDGLLPSHIQHYPIINSKLELLKGEESKRVFDYRVIVTDYNSISEASEAKKAELLQDLQQLVEDTAISEEDYNQKIENLNQYYTYNWQDFQEQRANYLINHYSKEYDFSTIFNEGFYDALAVGEELYICDIVGGEPIMERLNPQTVTIFRTGNSNKVEDADMIVIEDYWSPGRIVDTFYDVLTEKDRKYIEDTAEAAAGGADTDEMGNIHDERAWVRAYPTPTIADTTKINEIFGAVGGFFSNSIYDLNGNIKVTRVYWKSRRKIKKVTSYDPMTGEEVINMYPETYVADKRMGEKEEVLWINEAWEGTRIGKDVYVNIRPRPVQYNRLSNPSRCHFGIVGSLYTTNGNAPYSLVDMMKPYNYLYDVVHDRLNRIIARNYGKLVKFDIALVPDGWEPEKWMYYARKDGLAVVNSFNEGKKGTATGKLAGALNNNSNGVIDLDEGNTIQQYINLLEFAKLEMAEISGISKQREGQVSNRETVGGVERATLQSSHITESWFITHDNVKKRAIECFLETAKIAMKGRNVKFQYILPDFAQKMVEINGDEFAESDYGLVVDSSQQSQELNQKMDGLIQAALQNQMVNFSTALKMFTSCSLAEKMRMIENNEREIQQRQEQAQQQQIQVQQQQIQANAELEQQKMQLEDSLNERDNDTKLTIAMLQQNQETEIEPNEDNEKALLEKMREFDLRLQLDKDRLEFDRNKAAEDRKVKREQIHSKKTSTSK